jgi:TonB dependent receptor/Carboxypeptidase regulatory-like domain/TonB-dependent Receptor Plug Domain
MNDTLFSRRARRANRWTLLAVGLWLTSPVVARAQSEASEPAPSKESGDSDAAADAAAEAEADKELAAEEARAAGAVTKPPAPGKGGLWGVVKDTKFSEAIIEAQVQVVGRKERVLTDIDGRYRLDLPPGKYRIRVTFELHQPSRVDAVEIKAGQLTHIDVQLTPDEGAVEEVVIEEAVDTTTNEGVALTRKQSAVVGDGVGRAEIARTPDKNAAEAAQRVVGATIVDGRFVFVRGLGERYTNALLNGAPLPSPEPDRNTVPLDLFPSMVLDSLTIVKQFTPDMPADFAGGSVRIQTRDFPKQALFQIGLTGGYNTEATFRKRPGYYGSSTQWLGFDSGRRAFPPGIPNRRLGPDDSKPDLVAYGYRFNTLMSTMRKATPPNHGLTIVAGNGYKLGADKKLGVLLAFSYGRTYQLRDLIARKFQMGKAGDSPHTLLVGDDFAGTQGIDTVRWGAFGNASLEIDRHHTLSLLALRSQTGEDLTSELEGEFQSSAGAIYHTTHLEYVTRTLNFLQLRGEHRYPKLDDLQINWHASVATAAREQPDTRDVRYVKAERGGEPGWEFSSDASGIHSFFDQSDRTLAAGLDVLQPVIKNPEHETKLKFGGLLTSRDRAFRARRFQLIPSALGTGALYNDASFCFGNTWSTGCASQLFRPDLIRTDGLLLDEFTFNLDQYETGLDVYALYGMIDTKLTADLRVIAGVRPEITYQSFTGFDPFDRAGTATTTQLFQTDWLPGASVVYAVSKASNARFGASQTLARPQLREITPTLFTSFSGDYDVQGNENLQITKITNLDLRFENFPTLREVLAVSLFYKHFSKPIEEIVGSDGKLGFTNADGAYAVGVELEGRKTLDALAPQLKDFTVIGNLTLVKSQVELGNKGANSTNASRPLSYQSPYVINMALDYDNPKSQTEVRALYNVYGPRITAAGAIDMPDLYELPRQQVDLSVAQKFARHFELKLQAQNILNQPVVFAYRGVQGFKSKLDATTGVESFESVGNNPIVRRYNPGATFAMTATYTY